MLIGLTFSSELEAAGLLGLPFSWGSDGILQYAPSITSKQRAAIEAVLAAHNPLLVPPVVITPKDQAIDDILKLDSKTITLESLVKLLQVALIPPPKPTTSVPKISPVKEK